MNTHDRLLRDVRAAHRAARAARGRANAAIIALEFPDRPRPVYVCLGMGDEFSIVETSPDDGELRGVLIPFPKARR
jgi:hypothetical protein